MLQCLLIRKKLYAYVDKTLSEPEMLRVAGHIHGCPRCSAMAQRIQSILFSASAQSVPQPQKDFWDRFEAELESKIDVLGAGSVRQSAPLRYRFPMAVPALTMACMIILGVHFYLRQAVHVRGMTVAEQRLVKESLDYEFETAQSVSNDEDSLAYEMDLLDEMESNTAS